MLRLQLLKTVFLLFGILAGLYFPVSAQSDPVTVPDLTGLNVPAASALLNENGLKLGNQVNEAWTEASTQPANTISTQSLAPGSTIERGTTVDVTVLRSPNMLLIYDAESITFINQSNTTLDMNGLVFTALDGFTPASFPATNWMGSLDGGGNCTQLWAVPRHGSQKPAECLGVQRWLSTINTGVHFWTDLNGITRFNVAYNGVERAVCEAAISGQGTKQCSFYLPIGTAAGDVTAYIYLVYTTDRLIVLNQSADKWMPLAQTTIYNYNPNIGMEGGAALVVGDPQLFNSPVIAADITQLAPGQCLLFTNGPDVEGPPQNCNAIARLDIDPKLIFWAANFEVASVTDGQRHKCPAAVEGKMTVCVMPR